SDACQIMTIHKSKGLEFNICYYANLYAGFNIRDLNELFYYDSLYGIIVPYFNEGINNTFYKTLLREKYIKEEIEEKIRLFYVALSRCREKMIMIVDLDTNKIYDKDEEGLIELSSRLGYRSFRDIILSVKESLTPFIRDVNIEDIELSLDYNIKVDSDYSKRIPKTSIVIENDLIKIDSKPLKEASYSKKINELLDEDTLESIEIGKHIHYYLETLDFKNPDFSVIDSKYKNKIISFLNQDMLNDIEQSKIYKEYEFIYQNGDNELHGIIDLMLEFDDHIKIIDYKLKDINKKEYEDQLKGYQEYIKTISNKRVELYLYSIIDENYRKIQ
ncbi:MAG: 3'-5' exonuclease, partial [Bacilli bacterium]|nr:3'-5' exonuclease [Bacilli bacterium]